METYNNLKKFLRAKNKSLQQDPDQRCFTAASSTAMIPTVFISDLVRERQERNEAVVKEVDSRWAMAQTISGPYIFLPYKFTTTDATGKPLVIVNHLLILPENKQVTGKINHEIRERSIYKCCFIVHHLRPGNFVWNLKVTADQVQWSDANLFWNFDFKDIEENSSHLMVLIMNYRPGFRRVSVMPTKRLSAPFRSIHRHR